MIHPDLATLIRYRDGDLNGNRQALIKAHVDFCVACRRELDQFQETVAEVQNGAAPHEQFQPKPKPDMLATLRASMRKWEAEKAKPQRSGEALKSRVAMEIGPFLGTQASRKLLLTVSESGHNLLNTIEQVLVNFLGEQAAADLVNHVVDAAIVRNDL